MKTMNTKLIKLFNVALVENTPAKDMFKTVNQLAAQVGYFVYPDVCNESVLAFLKEQTINPNATFYKNWEDVTSKTRLELALDQVLHYLTTYGTDFALGNGYVPNDGENDAPTIDFKNFKVIMPISADELFERCWNMLCSGVALKYDTMQACADYVIEHVRKGKMINVDSIKNREAMIYICDALCIWPENAHNLFRLIMYKTTGDTMIVNNNDTIRKIKTSGHIFDFNKLSDTDLIHLSSIFLRYKKLFLAFKHNTNVDNRAAINKLRKLAIKNHKPFKAGFWQTLFSEMKSVEDIKAHLNELTTYKKIALMQLCKERYMMPKDNLYFIRNGKQFLKINDAIDVTAKELKKVSYAGVIYNILKDSIIDILKTNSEKDIVVTLNDDGTPAETKKAPKVVKVYSGMHITMPTSEKSFIGNYPFGTSFDLTKNNLIGCYWRGDWGTNDYDLSLIDIKGHKIGWNADYYNMPQNIIYSGDMTNAEPEAAEVIKIANPADVKALIKINQFYGQTKSKFELFFGQSDKPFIYKAYNNFMVDPNEIKFRATIEHENKKEMQVALIGNNKITLMEVHSGNSIVSGCHNIHNDDYINVLIAKTEYFVDAEEMLREAGFQIVDENYTGEVDIDFANLDKDSLLSLLA